MSVLRRAANPLRSQSYRILVGRSFRAEYRILSGNTELGGHIERENPVVGGRSLLDSYFYIPHVSLQSLSWSRNLSSKAGAKSSDTEDEVDEGFSDLDTPLENDKVEDVADKEEEEVAVSDEESLGLSDAEADSASERRTVTMAVSSPVFKIIMETPRLSINSALDKWVAEGNTLAKEEAYSILTSFRRRRIYGKALQFVEWLESKNFFDLSEREYAYHLELVAKVHGIQRAEKYLDKIPESCRGELLYRTLLANCVFFGNIKKSEEVFNKMKDLGLPTTIFAFNQLLILYKRHDRKKIPDVLLMMEKDGVKPDVFTYRLLVDIKGRANDIQGMEGVVELMEAEGMEPDLLVRAMLAKHYIFANLKEKAEPLLKEMEGDDINENRYACRELLPLYAALGKAEDVERIWKVCEPNPRLEECLTAIEAWGKLGKIENAEKVFDQMSKTYKQLSTRYYDALLKVYANHKLLTKGKDLAKRMLENVGRVGPMTWDAIVKLYVDAGEIEKADSILQKAVQQYHLKPMYSSYMALLHKYANRGDVHNAEKIFEKLRQAGYGGRMRQYQALLEAYVNAKTPAYGFRERLKAENLFANRGLAAQLAIVDGFKKRDISDLLD